MPMAHTETHLTTLCAWGHTVEWCWSCWDDERIADYDVILQLVRMRLIYQQVVDALEPDIYMAISTRYQYTACGAV